ncbi:hypothetical protein [Methanobrevibacter millerae]|uniref:Uncharacterized protein n=1 Tax=Methanobrevibacter millerae TaxID=230361 RepID=A0A1G5VH56_9EURY|nr:hypothetical protein [Methanobrevibacter millerae]SDA45104.1 hypothetical protein SAMN02910315_00598 [Methanobrevibacter millerae]
MTNQEFEEDILELPDTSLPFLLYGIYKPKKFKWNKINNIQEINSITFSNDHIKKIIPLEIKSNKKYYDKGYLIHFNEQYSEEAYSIINDSESPFCEWKTIEIDGNPVNLLINKQKKNNFHPDDYSNPFFAYGIFKPGQIAFSKICKCVKSIEKVTLNSEMILMDAMALISESYSRKNSTDGYLIHFKDGKENEAYNIISSTEPKEFYKWKTILIKDNPTNVLIGIHPKMDGPFKKVITNYDGASDLFFMDALDLIEKEKYSNDFFKLQMNYLLLWASIERFCVLKYGEKTSSRNNQRFAGERMFRNFIKNNYKNHNREVWAYERCVFSPKKLKDVYFDIEDCRQIIEYYYAIRCNVAHRGKATNELNTVRASLNELLIIFRDILKDTFNIVTIEDINFHLPYGFKEISEEITDDAILKTFKKDESILIEGIPNYEINIIIQENNELENTFTRENGLLEGNVYKFVENNKLVEIKINDEKIRDIINEFFIN